MSYTKVKILGKPPRIPMMMRGNRRGLPPPIPPPHSSPLAVQNGGQHLSCDLCLQGFDDLERSSSDMESGMLTKMIQNLCHHLQLPSTPNNTSIPDFNVLPNEKVPLCITCKNKMKWVWTLQGKMEEIEGQITEAVKQIERTVADSEIIKKETNLVANSNGQGRISQLREMILNGYRNKLWRIQESKNNPILLELGNHQQQQDPIPGMSVPFFVTDSFARELDNGDEDDDDDDSDEIEILEISHASSSTASRRTSSGIGSNTSTSHMLDSRSSSFIGNEGREAVLLFPADAAFDDDYDAESVPEGDENGNRQRSQEDQEEIADDDDETTDPSDCDYEEEEVKEDYDILTIEPQESKWMFDGVEIFTCTGSKPGFKYLQCGSCNYTLDIPADAMRSSQATIQMKRHIHSAHKNGSQATKENGTSTSASRLLRRPKSTSTSTSTHGNKTRGSMQCDICKRHTKGGILNLRIHKVSHMNETERQEALVAASSKAEDRTFYKFLLNRNQRFDARGKKAQLPATSKKRRHSDNSSSSGSGDDEVNTEANRLSCLFCDKSFKRKNYLKLHLQIHANLMQPRERTKPPQKTPTFHPKSKEKFLYDLGLVRVAKMKESRGSGR